MADPEGANQRSMSRAGITPQIIRSWRAPRQVYRDLRGMPDSVLIVVLMAAMLIFWVAQLPAHARAAQIAPEVPLNARIGGALLAVMFIMPLLCYLVAAIVSGLSRLTGRPITPPDSRLALFWALLVIAPLMLFLGLIAGFIGATPLLTIFQMLTGLAFLLVWGAGLAELSGKK